MGLQEERVISLQTRTRGRPWESAESAWATSSFLIEYVHFQGHLGTAIMSLAGMGGIKKWTQVRPATEARPGRRGGAGDDGGRPAPEVPSHVPCGHGPRIQREDS